MPKLHVEVDGPLMRPDGCVILKDGQPLNNVASLSLLLSAEGETPEQTISLSQVFAAYGIPSRSDVTHTISKMTLSLEYQEA